MNSVSRELVLDALKEALSLIWDEYESLDHDELKSRYDEVIQKLQNAVAQIESP